MEPGHITYTGYFSANCVTNHTEIENYESRLIWVTGKENKQEPNRFVNLMRNFMYKFITKKSTFATTLLQVSPNIKPTTAEKEIMIEIWQKKAEQLAKKQINTLHHIN